jgi:hypothetical protein
MGKPLEKQQPLGPIGGSLRVTGTPFGMQRAGSALARYTPNSIKWPDHDPKVLAPVVVCSEKVATGAYIGESRSNILSAPDRALTRSSYLFLDQRRVVAREVMQGVEDAPFPPGRVGPGHDA